jgi:WD40 repeat protein/mono/diheme cytochrome c family protein
MLPALFFCREAGKVSQSRSVSALAKQTASVGYFPPMKSLVRSLILLPLAAIAAPGEKDKDDPNAPVSYFKKIRPLFQANCQGCHQPAKAKGGYVMTDFARLVAGGDDAEESGKKAIVPGKPDESHLVQQITQKDGQAEMPPKKPPLHETEIALVKRWIAEGAADDTPANAKQRFDAEHPPTYVRPPVITSLDFSPDGSLLAVAGFHEVLLWKGDGSELLGRLIGLSERVQSVRFSPDGKRLAVAAGRPAQMGDVQIWDVAKRSLILSVPFGYDTIYGVNWSPDGKLVSFGAPDNSLRAADAESGKLVLQQSSHNDWVLDTAFSKDGSQIVSVGRDMSAKLTEVASQRFIDNISSITPGALRGGLQAVSRHPERDEFLVGGSDGIPQAYRTVRKVQRKIGDNALCIRKWPTMQGRIYAMDFAPDGKKFAAGSSLDGKGSVNFYNYDFSTEMPQEFVNIEAKDDGSRSAEEKKKLGEHYHSETKLLGSVSLDAGVYALCFKPDGTIVAAAGEDGKVRFISPGDAKIVKEFVPVPLSPATAGK